MAVSDESSGRPTPSGRRRGRPPATDSADTLRAILDAARALFGERGYAAVTNKDVASAAGITTGALYHYVESKLDLYAAVDRDMQREMYKRFPAAVASADTFLGKLTAIMEVSHEMAKEDPTLTAFVTMVRVDSRRHPEVAEVLARSTEAREQMFVGIVDAGVATGEFTEENKPLMVEFVRAVLIGLAHTMGYSAEQHRHAVDAVTGLFRGTIYTPVS